MAALDHDEHVRYAAWEAIEVIGTDADEPTDDGADRR